MKKMRRIYNMIKNMKIDSADFIKVMLFNPSPSLIRCESCKHCVGNINTMLWDCAMDEFTGIRTTDVANLPGCENYWSIFFEEGGE